MAEAIIPNPNSAGNPDVNVQETGPKQQTDTSGNKGPAIGNEEQQTVNRIRLGGDEDQTVKAIADGAIIDMVQDSDGKWGTKDSRDSSYFFDPATRQANEQHTPASGGSPTPTGETVSPRDRWNKMERQQETKRQQELARLHTEGSRFASLVYTPEGQQIVAETQRMLTQIVDTQAENSRPHLTTSHVEDDVQQVQVIRSQNAELLAKWNQQKQVRVQQLLEGEQMNNLEQSAYLRLTLGREPLTTTNQAEIQQREILLGQFDRTRRDIGRAIRYQRSEAQPMEQRPAMFSEGSLRFYGIPTLQAQEVFARGWDEIRINHQQKTEEQPQTLDVISQEQIDTYKRTLSERYGIDLSSVSVDIVRPGDEVFDAEEIKFKYFQHPDDPALSELRELLEQRETNPQSAPIDRLRAAAEQSGIALEGRMPGFAAISGNNRIVFLAVRVEDAISMAQRYAEKEGEAGRVFTTSEDAGSYLRSLGEKAFLHEVGHVIYSRTGESSISEWTSYVETNQPLKDRVIAIQQDKYENATEIPVAEEAFADYFVDVVGGGRVKSRLQPDPEAIKRVSRILIPEQPDNRVEPGEVIDNLNRLREKLKQAKPLNIVNNSSAPKLKLDEFGEIQEQ